jgi:hypothetical protein
MTPRLEAEPIGAVSGEGGSAMSKAHNLTVATIQEHCRGLRLPTVAAQSERLAAESLF